VLAGVLLIPVGGHNLLLLLCTRSLLPLSASRAMKMIGGRDVRVYPSNKHSHTIGSPSSPLVVVGYEWVRDDVLKYRSSITSTTSVAHWGVN